MLFKEFDCKFRLTTFRTSFSRTPTVTAFWFSIHIPYTKFETLLDAPLAYSDLIDASILV